MKRLLTYSILLLLFACGRKTENNKPRGLFPIKEFGKWGYINSEGQIVIKCQSDWAGHFSCGLAAILKDSCFGFIDTTGKIVIKPQFDDVEEFSEGLCNVIIRKDTVLQKAVIKTDGSIAFYHNYTNLSLFKYGRATVDFEDELCVIDITGKILFKTKTLAYGGGQQFKDGILRVFSEPGIKYFDRSGKVIIFSEAYQQGNEFSEGLASIRLNDSTFFIDKFGRIKLTPSRPELLYEDFSEGLAQASTGGNWNECKTGFIDKSGNVVIPIKYHIYNNFSNGLVAFEEKRNLWGFLNKKGEIVIKPQFEEVEFEGFVNGLCRAKKNNQWGYINTQGKFVWKEQFALEYSKIDLSKWNLDSMNAIKPLNSEKIAGRDNIPRSRKFPRLNELILKVDTADITVYDDKYFAHKLYLINASNDTIKISAQDGRIKIIQQAKNKSGEWQDIENFYNSWCGHSYHTLKLKPNQYQIFATPIFKGEFKTKLRFKFENNKKAIYSNTFSGHINQSQFLQSKDKDNTSIMAW